MNKDELTECRRAYNQALNNGDRAIILKENHRLYVDDLQLNNHGGNA
jgi:hypothetical protein